MIRRLQMVFALGVFALPVFAEDEAIDEVVALEQKPTRVLRAELRLVELQMYDEFNELNKDDDYDIICKKFARVGSQIPRTSCKAKMFWDAEADFASDGGIGEGQLVNFNLPTVPESKKHGTLLRMKMLKAAIENSEFRETLKRRKLLVDTIDARRED